MIEVVPYQIKTLKHNNNTGGGGVWQIDSEQTSIHR